LFVIWDLGFGICLLIEIWDLLFVLACLAKRLSSLKGYLVSPIENFIFY